MLHTGGAYGRALGYGRDICKQLRDFAPAVRDFAYPTSDLVCRKTLFRDTTGCGTGDIMNMGTVMIAPSLYFYSLFGIPVIVPLCKILIHGI